MHRVWALKAENSMRPSGLHSAKFEIHIHVHRQENDWSGNQIDDKGHSVKPHGLTTHSECHVYQTEYVLFLGAATPMQTAFVRQII